MLLLVSGLFLIEFSLPTEEVSLCGCKTEIDGRHLQIHPWWGCQDLFDHEGVGSRMCFLALLALLTTIFTNVIW